MYEQGDVKLRRSGEKAGSLHEDPSGHDRSRPDVPVADSGAPGRIGLSARSAQGASEHPLSPTRSTGSGEGSFEGLVLSLQLTVGNRAVTALIEEARPYVSFASPMGPPCCQ